MTSRSPSLSLIALFALAACGGGTSLFIYNSEVVATVRLGKVTHPKWGDVVWGTLSIEGTNRPLKSANLGCFTLRIGDSTSENIYVSSIASVLTQGYPAREGKVIVPVYWAMKDFVSGTNADLARAQLAIKPTSSGSCFEFDSR